MGDGSNGDAAGAQGQQQAPVQDETGRGRLERDRRAGDGGPHVPERQGQQQMRVLDRSAVSRQASPDHVGVAVEVQPDETRMTV